MIKNILIITCLLAASNHSLGQLLQTDRFEMEVGRTDEPYYIIPVDSFGLYLFHETDDKAQGEKRFDLIQLSTSLKKVNELSLFIDDDFQWLGYGYSGPELYLLFRQNDNQKSDLYVVKVNADSKAVKNYEIKNELDFDITHFDVTKNTAVMGGYVNDRPALILYDFDKEQIKILPGFYHKDSRLIDVTVNLNNTFNILIYNEESSRKKNLQLKVYDWKGNLLAEDEFSVPEDKSLFSGISSRLINEHLVISGAFGSSNSRLSEGIYWAKADLSKKQAIKLIPFGELTSFFDYLPEKRKEKMKKKTETSSREFVHKDHVIMHRLIEKNGKFYILAEVFDPNYAKQPVPVNPYYPNRYRYASRYRMNPNSNSRYRRAYTEQYDSKEFTNIDYVESLVISLNEKGDILWDQALVLDRFETNELVQITDVTILDDRVALAYKDEDELKYKIVDGHETIKGDTTVNVMLSQDDDVLRNEKNSEGGIRYWFDGVFYVWGYQSIKRTEEDGKEKLNVFYINKMEMDN